ncbi:hypothetical protein COT72_00985 [archaeon CG10_big_fil_rev_8_21_14_0_10_43_11]|nr:MAG: hypothetical protein COT72_00985 [archaeon CG10_big_fil_rev_8_21_14_0_10_43_11]
MRAHVGLVISRTTFFHAVKRGHSNFVKLNILFLIFFPLFVASVIAIFQPQLFQLWFFIILLEISFAQGLSDDYRKPKARARNYVLGMSIAFIQAILFVKFLEPVHFIVAFPLYLWAWLEMYNTGLQITPKTLNDKEIASTLLTTLASIGTMSGIWLSAVA